MHAKYLTRRETRRHLRRTLLDDSQSSGRKVRNSRFGIIRSGGTDCPTSHLGTHRVNSFSGEFIPLLTIRKIERQLNFQSASALNPDGRETPQGDTDSYYSKRLAKIFEFVKSFAKKKLKKFQPDNYL